MITLDGAKISGSDKVVKEKQKRKDGEGEQTNDHDESYDVVHEMQGAIGLMKDLSGGVKILGIWLSAFSESECCEASAAYRNMYDKITTVNMIQDQEKEEWDKVKAEIEALGDKKAVIPDAPEVIAGYERVKEIKLTSLRGEAVIKDKMKLGAKMVHGQYGFVVEDISYAAAASYTENDIMDCDGSPFGALEGKVVALNVGK